MQPPGKPQLAAEIETLPDHTQLPDEDGTFVHKFLEHPQSELLTGSLLPRLRELHPDGQFCVGQDNGIYWRSTRPPLDGCKAPDWFYVPGVPPLLDGQVRRSYVLWQESLSPLLVIEYVSGDGSEERDATPYKGKFWVYGQAIRADYYLIFDPQTARVEAYHLTQRRYERLEPNADGRIFLKPLRAEFGLWEGDFRGQPLVWLRAWDTATGQLMPHPDECVPRQRKRAETAESLLDDTRRSVLEECERAENERRRANDEARLKDLERQRADAERKRADEEARLKDLERQRAERLAEKLRALGLNPEAP